MQQRPGTSVPGLLTFERGLSLGAKRHDTGDSACGERGIKDVIGLHQPYGFLVAKLRKTSDV